MQRWLALKVELARNEGLDRPAVVEASFLLKN